MIRLHVIVATLLCAAALPAQSSEWTSDMAASQLEFVATFERAPAAGAFRQFEVRLLFDADRPAQGRLEVTIATKSADMKSADVNRAIGGAQWFDAARFPQAQFQATEIRKIDPNRYVARGTLSLKGVRQPVEVPFAWTQGVDTARMEGELVLERRAFGIGTGEWSATNVIGADVKIRFDVRLRKRG